MHTVRTMFGNGLRAEIWEEFVSRFGIKQISEIYGSTEGNASIGRLKRFIYRKQNSKVKGQKIWYAK